MPTEDRHEPGPIHLPTREGYDCWAAVYDDDGNPLIAMEEPRVAALLGDVREKQILDVGCGTGRHALRLASAGAVVQALDFSAAMLERARQKPGSQKVTFRVHDLGDSLPFPNASFDRVLCALVLDHVKDLEGLFAEMLRVCRPQGFVVISVMHPALMLRGVQARFHDPSTGNEVRPESVPNQLSDYIMAAVRAGFKLDHLSEQFVDDKLAATNERARRYLEWPLLLLMRLLP
jgi:ubiquinone/menaquinone biosynthesis C-methylase UbiE